MTVDFIRAKKRAFAGMAFALSGALALAGCSGASTGGDSEGGISAGNAGGESLPVGATKDQYIAAFEDIEPITIHTQTPGPKGSTTSQNMESYVAAVEEWSGGKITFDVAFSNAVAQPADIDDALNDGRLDLGQVLPIYEPSDYPATNALIEAGILNDSSAVVGVLQSNAWSNEVAFNTPEIMQEWDDHGLTPLVPIFNSGANGLFCSSPHNSLADNAGASIAAGGTIQSAQVSALGASPTSIAYTELFESLQRGVVECSVSSETVGLLGGFLTEAPFATIDPEATFAAAPGGLAFSKNTWETLPLPAQQLFWDKLDIFVGENITAKIWPNSAEADLTIQAAGGEFSVFDEEAREAILAINSEVLETLKESTALDGETLISNAETASKSWRDKVIELGYPEDIEYAGFADWWDADNTDISAYLEAVNTEVFEPQRPGE